MIMNKKSIEKIELAMMDLEEAMLEFHFMASLTPLKDEEITEEDIKEYCQTTLDDLEDIEQEIKRVKDMIKNELKVKDTLSKYVEFSDHFLPSVVSEDLYGYVVKEQSDDTLLLYLPFLEGTKLGHNNDTEELKDVCQDNCWVVHKDNVHYTHSLFEETDLDEFEDEEKEDEPFVSEMFFYSDDVNDFSEEAAWIDFHTGETQEVSNEYTDIEQENKELKEAYEKLENKFNQIYVENARLNKELSQYENLVKKLNYYIKGFGVA